MLFDLTTFHESYCAQTILNDRLPGMEQYCLMTIPSVVNCQHCGRRTTEVHVLEFQEGILRLLCQDCCPACRTSVVDYTFAVACR